MRALTLLSALAVGVDGGGEEDLAPVGGPDCAVGFGGDSGYLLWLAGLAGGQVEAGDVDLLGAAAAAGEEDLLAVQGEAGAVVAGLSRGKCDRVAAGDGLEPDSRCLCIFGQIDVGCCVDQPFAIR